MISPRGNQRRITLGVTCLSFTWRYGLG